MGGEHWNEVGALQETLCFKSKAVQIAHCVSRVFRPATDIDEAKHVPRNPPNIIASRTAQHSSWGEMVEKRIHASLHLTPPVSASWRRISSLSLYCNVTTRIHHHNTTRYHSSHSDKIRVLFSFAVLHRNDKPNCGCLKARVRALFFFYSSYKNVYASDLFSSDI